MNFELKEPVLIIGLGGVGSKLATRAKESLEYDCLLVSNDSKDLGEEDSIKISTNSIVNPSSQAIRGFAFESAEQIRERISGYSSIILMANLAGKAGSAIAPVVSSICKKEDKNLISFAVMPFRYENDRIFASGVSLKRIKEDSACTVIADNDAMLESNPNLSARECYEMANSALLHMAESIGSCQIPDRTNVLTTGGDNHDIEASLRDSFKMLYEHAPPNSVRRSVIHVLGGDDVPVGMMRTIASLTRAVGESAQVDISSVESDTSGIVMLSAVQGETKFDSYDPLGSIPAENTLDWDHPDCSYDCKLDLYQLE